MNQSTKNEIRWQTGKGEVQIRGFATPEEIRQYEFSPQFGTHASYKSLYTKRETLEEKAGQTGSNVTLALVDDRMIIGFGVLSYPDPDERWYQLKPDIMMEVKAVEVARARRSVRIANNILNMLVSHPDVEEKITYMVGYSWTWDLDGTKKSAQEYRRMLIRLFEPFGFMEYQTNEPNICLKPENLFMGRIGKKVSEKTVNAFKWIRFGIYP